MTDSTAAERMSQDIDIPIWTQHTQHIQPDATCHLCTPPIHFPAQCPCGHVYSERYLVLVSSAHSDNPTHRPFVWCGWCRTRVDLPVRIARKEAP